MLLKSIKENSKGVVTYVIVGLISLTFVITALYGIDFSGSSNAVAIVNDDEISQDDFRSEFNAKKRRLQQELAEKYTAEFDNALKQSTLESMINRRLLNQLASELGYATTGRELQALIRSNNVFKIDGKFSLEKYKQMLRLNGYSDTQYETIKSAELTQGQVKYNLLNSAFVTPYALQSLSKLNNQQRKFSYVKLNADDYKSKVKFNDEILRKEYELRKKDVFIESRKVKVNFIELSLSQVAKDIKVNDDELFNFYDDEKERFTTEEERQAQHILVESEQQAEQIITQLNSGADFAKLAETHSLDTGSKDAGGDLGFFSLGVMMSEFEDKVFSMKVSEVSSPVKTEFGYHVIKLNNIQTGTVKPFDEIRVELSELYTQRAAQKSLYDLTEQLTNLAYEASLEEAADQMNLKLNTSEFFAQNSTEFEPKFVSAAYSDLVLNKGENSELIELSKDKFVVLRVKDKLAQRQKSFNEAKAQINTLLTIKYTKIEVDNIANKISDLLTNGDNKAAQVLMDKNQLEWKEVGWVKRNSDKANVVIVNQVFALPKPTNATTYSAQSLNKRQSIVIALSKVKTTDDTSTKALERSLLNFESDAMFNGILTTLRKNADLEIFTERL